jgi:hypothetical protein
VNFSIDIKDNIMVGDPIDLSLKVKNNEEEARMISGSVTISCTDYTGDVDNEVLWRQLSGQDRFIQANDGRSTKIRPFKLNRVSAIILMYILIRRLS